MRYFKLAGVAAIALSATAAQAVTYDLAADFSDISNPNGVWSFTYLGSPLARQMPVLNGNAFIAAVANGYWGQGPDLNVNTPEIAKAIVNGSAAGETDLDFLAGDVVLHSPNDGNTIDVNWTAPGAGTISISGAVWYAHSAVNRSNVVSIFVNGAFADSTTVDNSTNRNSAIGFFGGLPVSAGDVLSLRFAKSSGQQFGSINGVNFVVDFTATRAVPEPASWAMMIAGFGAIGFAMRRRAVSVRYA